MAEEGGQAQLKWEGKAKTKLSGSKPEQVWPHFEDFCSLHKYLPGIDTCYRVDGVSGQPGLIRYCSNTVPSPSSSEEPSSDDDDDEDETKKKKMIKTSSSSITYWCNEKLLAIDPIKRCLTYEVQENNMGMKSYVATIEVSAIDGDDGGCEIEWSFATDPIEGYSFDGLSAYIDSSIKVMGERIEKEIETEKEKEKEK